MPTSTPSAPFAQVPTRSRAVGAAPPLLHPLPGTAAGLRTVRSPPLGRASVGAAGGRLLQAPAPSGPPAAGPGGRLAAGAFAAARSAERRVGRRQLLEQPVHLGHLFVPVAILLHFPHR